jgi:hypothetical protein
MAPILNRGNYRIAGLDSVAKHLGSRPRPEISFSSADLALAFWGDPLFYPPAANQACWVRRLPFDTPPLRCTWNDTSECFSTDTEALEIDIPWYNVLRWRPRSS